jgi:hypothetical protein
LTKRLTFFSSTILRLATNISRDSEYGLNNTGTTFTALIRGITYRKIDDIDRPGDHGDFEVLVDNNTPTYRSLTKYCISKHGKDYKVVKFNEAMPESQATFNVTKFGNYYTVARRYNDGPRGTARYSVEKENTGWAVSRLRPHTHPEFLSTEMEDAAAVEAFDIGMFVIELEVLRAGENARRLEELLDVNDIGVCAMQLWLLDHPEEIPKAIFIVVQAHIMTWAIHWNGVAVRDCYETYYRRR